MVKWKKGLAKYLALSLVFTLTVLATGCGQQETQESKETGGTGSLQTVEIPCLDGALCGAPLYVAKEKGFFEEEGIDAKLIAADAETRKLGLNNGTYPIVNGDFQFFQSIEQGVSTKVVDGLHNGCIKILVRPDSKVTEPADLKGKKIGVDEVGGPPHQVASMWLEQGGVSAQASAGDVVFLPYTDGNLELEALYSGDVDAVAIWDPLASAAEKAGKAKVICDIASDSIFAGRYCCFLYASNKVLEENPAQVSALIRAIHKAEDWINKNPEETVNLVIKGNYSQVEDKELAVQLIKEYVYPTEEERKTGDRSTEENVKYFAGQLHQIGYLTEDAEEFTKKAFEQIDVNAK